MTKFLVQLLLSVIVSVSAAVGFNTYAREKIHEISSEAKAILRETTQSALETVSGVDTNLEASVDADIEAQAELEAETDVEAEIENAALELESELESDVDLDLGLGK